MFLLTYREALCVLPGGTRRQGGQRGWLQQHKGWTDTDRKLCFGFFSVENIVKKRRRWKGRRSTGTAGTQRRHAAANCDIIDTPCGSLQSPAHTYSTANTPFRQRDLEIYSYKGETYQPASLFIHAGQYCCLKKSCTCDTVAALFPTRLQSFTLRCIHFCPVSRALGPDRRAIPDLQISPGTSLLWQETR